MADEQIPQHQPPSDVRHDTSVLSWPPAEGVGPGTGWAPGDAPAGGWPATAAPGPVGQWGSESPQPAGYGGYGPMAGGADALPGGPQGLAGVGLVGSAPDGSGSGWMAQGAPGNPEASYWESRYRRQRTWTRLLGATLAACLLLLVGGGLLVWTVLLPRATSSVSQSLSDALPELGTPNPGPDGTAPAPVKPDGPADEAPAPGQQDLSEVPLPEALRGIGSMLGIHNVEELLDTAVSMGLMTQEQADRIRAAVGSGGSLEDLLGSGGLGGLGSGSASGSGSGV